MLSSLRGLACRTLELWQTSSRAAQVTRVEGVVVEEASEDEELSDADVADAAVAESAAAAAMRAAPAAQPRPEPALLDEVSDSDSDLQVSSGCIKQLMCAAGNAEEAIQLCKQMLVASRD